jgi:hypothetical protein
MDWDPEELEEEEGNYEVNQVDAGREPEGGEEDEDKNGQCLPPSSNTV